MYSSLSLLLCWPSCVEPLAAASAGLIDLQAREADRIESDSAGRRKGVPPSIGREGEYLATPLPLNLARPPQLRLLRGARGGQLRASELRCPAG